MKRLKWMLTVLTVSVLFACVGLFAACTDPDDPDDPDGKVTYYTVTVSPYDEEGGTVTVSDPESSEGYVKDEQVTVTVEAATDHTVGEVKVNGAPVELTEGKYTFNVAGDTTVAATFEEIPYYIVTVSPYDEEGGTVKLSDPANAKGYGKNEQVTLTVTPAADHIVKEVKVNDTPVDLTDGEYTFNVTDNTTVAVTFEKIYTVTITQYDDEIGTVKLSDPENGKGYVKDEQVTLTVAIAADHKEDYEVGEVKVNGVTVQLDGEGKHTFAVSENTTISVTFKKLYFTVTAEPNHEEMGTVKLSDASNPKGYTENEQVTITVSPEADYEVGTVRANDTILKPDQQGKYTFSVTQDTEVTVKFGVKGLRGKTWTDTGYSSTAGLGTIAFDGDFNMTLTPSGGEAQVVTVTTAGVDFAYGIPNSDINVRVGESTNVKAYKVSFGMGIIFTEGYTEHIFDGAESTDFSEYVGTWKQYNSTGEIEITATGFTYLGTQYAKYYAAFDGSYYIKYQMTALTKPQRYPFGYFDNAKQIIYINMNGNMRYFTADSQLPKATFPADFYGEWWNQTYFGLSISAAEAAVDGKEVSAFAVAGEGDGAIVHAYYNNLYVKFYLQESATSSETEVVMDNGTIKTIFTAVKSEPLPVEYKGEWTELEGEGKISVGEDGKITYEGTAYEVTRDARDFGFHFTTAAGMKATLIYFDNGGVLALDDGNGHISYYAKVALSELGDLAASGVPEGTWTSGEWTITVSSDHKVTLSKNGEEAKAVRIVFGEDNVMIDDEPHYNGEAIYDGVYYEFDYNKVTGVITLTKYTDFARKTTEELTFTQPE